MTTLSRFYRYPLNLLQTLGRNPIALKELRSRMRGGRAFGVLTIYLSAMASFIVLIYLAYNSSSGVYGPDPRDTGKAIFSTMVSLQVFMVLFIAPAFTAGAIVSEKERQTYDILRTTLLSEKALVSGKLTSALAYVFLLIAAAIPLESIAFLMGGVELIELIISQLMLVVGALTYALVGLYFSTIMKSTVAASVSTFGFVMVVTVALPILIVFGASLFGAWFFNISPPAWLIEALLIYGGLILASTNLPASLIISELILINEGALWAFDTSISGHTVWILSPWYLFLIMHTFLIWLFYRAILKRLRTP